MIESIALFELFAKAFDFSDHETLFSFIFVSALFLVRNRAVRFSSSRTDKIARMVGELTNIKNVKNQFIIEQLFLDRFGKLIDYPVIAYLLKTNTPSKNIASFLLAKNHFIYDFDEACIAVNTRRRWLILRAVLFFILYFLFAMIMLGFLFYSKINYGNFHLALLVASGLSCLSFLCIEGYVSSIEAISLAKRFGVFKNKLGMKDFLSLLN